MTEKRSAPHEPSCVGLAVGIIRALTRCGKNFLGKKRNSRWRTNRTRLCYSWWGERRKISFKWTKIPLPRTGKNDNKRGA